LSTLKLWANSTQEPRKRRQPFLEENALFHMMLTDFVKIVIRKRANVIQTAN